LRIPLYAFKCITCPMVRRQGNEEKVNRPVKLRPSRKMRLKQWQKDHNLDTFDDAISVLLDIAEKYGKDIEIQTEPSVSIKGDLKGW